MLPDRVSNPGPLTYESGALPIALRGPVFINRKYAYVYTIHNGTGSESKQSAYIYAISRNTCILATF